MFQHGRGQYYGTDNGQQRCEICGKFNHRTSECYSRCWYCRNTGHIVMRCPFLPPDRSSTGIGATLTADDCIVEQENNDQDNSVQQGQPEVSTPVTDDSTVTDRSSPLSPKMMVHKCTDCSNTETNAQMLFVHIMCEHPQSYVALKRRRFKSDPKLDSLSAAKTAFIKIWDDLAKWRAERELKAASTTSRKRRLSGAVVDVITPVNNEMPCSSKNVQSTTTYQVEHMTPSAKIPRQVSTPQTKRPNEATKSHPSKSMEITTLMPSTVLSQELTKNPPTATTIDDTDIKSKPICICCDRCKEARRIRNHQDARNVIKKKIQLQSATKNVLIQKPVGDSSAEATAREFSTKNCLGSSLKNDIISLLDPRIPFGIESIKFLSATNTPQRRRGNRQFKGRRRPKSNRQWNPPAEHLASNNVMDDINAFRHPQNYNESEYLNSTEESRFDQTKIKDLSETSAEVKNYRIPKRMDYLNFECSMCSFSHTHITTLVNHYRVQHSGVHNCYVCTICSATFNDKGSFRRHLTYEIAKFKNRYNCP